MRENLKVTLPHICAYFGRDDFMDIAAELDRYSRNVRTHYRQFIETQHAWQKIMAFLQKEK